MKVSSRNIVVFSSAMSVAFCIFLFKKNEILKDAYVGKNTLISFIGIASQVDGLNIAHCKKKILTELPQTAHVLKQFKKQSEVHENVSLPDINQEEFLEQQHNWERFNELFFSEEGERFLHRLLKDEVEDPEWSIRVADQMDTVLEGEGYSGSYVDEIDCRERLCRVELYHSNLEEAEHFRENGAVTGPWGGDQYGIVLELENGAQETIFYFSRDGLGSEPFEDFKDRLLEKSMATKDSDTHI